MKTLNMAVLTGAYLALACSSAQARIGETQAEIQTRYGKPSKLVYKSQEDRTCGYVTFPPGTFYGLPTTNYLFKEYLVSVSFKEGKSVRESVVPRKLRVMSAEEGESLLAGIGAGIRWGEKIGTDFRHSEEGDVARVKSSGVMVESAAFRKHYTDLLEKEKREQADRGKKKADGF